MFDMWSGRLEFEWELNGMILYTDPGWGISRYEVMLDGDRLSLLYLPEQELASPQVAEVFIRDDVQAYQQQDSPTQQQPTTPSTVVSGVDLTVRGQIEWILQPAIPDITANVLNPRTVGEFRNLTNNEINVRVRIRFFDERGVQLDTAISSGTRIGPGNVGRLSNVIVPLDAVRYEIFEVTVGVI